MKMGPCEDPSGALHEGALGQDSLTAFVQRHDSELPYCLKAGLELTGINAAPHEMQNGFGEPLCDQIVGCLSYDYMERAAANNRDCLVGERANVAVPILEKVLDDEFGASRGCLNESRIEIGSCYLKKEGLCMEKAGLQGKDGPVISIETRETSAIHLKRNCVDSTEHKDDNGVNGPSSKGLVEEKGDSLVVIESNSRDHLSAYCEIPVERQSMAGPSHCLEQDILEDDKLVSCTFTKRILKLIGEEHDALVGTETLSCNESVPPEGFEMPSESMFAGYSPKQHIQLDVHKCSKSTGSPYVEGFIRVSEERSGVLDGADSLSCKPILPSEGAEVSTPCLDAKSIQQGEQKDDKIIDCPFVERAMEVKEGMIFNGEILPSYRCEILSESMPVTILSKNCDEENVLDSHTFRGLDSNTDTLYQIEAHSCKLTSLPEGDELSIKSLKGDLPSSGWHDNQKSETGDSDLYTERSAKAVEINNCAKTCVHVLSPQHEHSNGKDVAGPSVESNSELLEEKNDSRTDVKLEICSQLSSIGQNAFNSEKGFFGMAANCLVERPTSLQLTGCPGVVEHSSFMSLDVKDCLRRRMFGAIDCVSAVDSSGQEDNKEISIFKVDQFSKIKISENVSLSSPTSNQTRKSSQKSKGKKASRKRSDAAKVPHQHEILEYILKSPKRKRSHFSRVARCAFWGSMGNITQHFKQSNGLGLDYVLNQESLKSLGRQESGMRNKSGKGGSSRRSSRKSSASTSVLRLKVKVGSENCHQSYLKNVIPEVLDTTASAGANINNSGSNCCLGGSIEPSKSANGIKHEWGEEVSEMQLFSVDKYLENAKTELDVGFHGANCVCTLFPDKLGRDGANLGIASHLVNEALGGTIDRTFADPGTSPDSEVINIVPDAEVVRKPEELNGYSYRGAVAHNKKGKKKGNLPYVLNQESLKSSLGGQESGMRNKSGKGGSSRRSSRKSSASTSVLRLKVKVGSENCHQSYMKNVIPEVLDATASAGANINNSGSDCCPGGSIEPSKSANCIKDEWGEEVSEKLLFSVDKYPENAKTELDTDSHGANCECSLVPDKLGRDGANLGFASHMVVEAFGGTIDRTFADPATSPNSEITNIVPDAEVITKPEEELNGSSYSGAFSRNKKGKKKGNLPYVGADIIKTAKPLKNGGGKQKLGARMSPSESLTSSTIGTASSISSSSRDMELLSLPRETKFEVPGENLKVKICLEDEKCRDVDGHLGLSESENSVSMLYSANSERVQPTKSSKPEGLSMERSKVSDLAKSREGSASCKRGSKQKSINKGKVKEKTTHDHAANRVGVYPESGKHMEVVNGSDNVVSINSLDMTSGGVIEQSSPVESAWIHCDDCHKWRRISDALVNSIDESSPWSCKDNMDKAFADCSIPQEMSNADINAELGISDADEDIYDSSLNQKWSEYKCITVSQDSSFKRIDANEFPHRSRKNQTIDEIMVCHCKPPQDGWLGCGDQCLNRMLNIECVQGTCPCGDICSNQQFQKRQYAGMKWVRCGKKGFGLQLQEDISKGQFLIEYVGEVLDMHAYEARQREYAAKGHKHFYFMTLNGGEVIDACAKGNLGRFINHSCDPNCRTEKWMVNGEICIGLFALKDIKKGEEVTFDYNYVRVFGAAVKKCHCGSPQCRGYIGGETHNAEIIVQGDSDEEFPEPVMLEDGKTGVHLKDMRRRTNSFDNEDMKSVEVPVLKSEMRMTTEIEDAINLSASATSQPHSSPELEASKKKSLCSSQPVEVSPQTVSASKSTSRVNVAIPPENTLCSVQVLEKSFSVDIDAGRKSKSETVKGKRVFSKSRFLIKTSHGSLKKGKINGNLPNENKVQMIANKPLVLSVRPKRLVEGSSDGRFEAVEEKLNELLDANGGISKRKEAPKIYLKLLLLTAASGGSGNGEAIQSNRDLSMILDALLKTKSRVVLVDIINKNGLRMLHNIMKQYRKDFKKIPILRKLLKVLEYLATREILAFDHINGGPPCPGMESFMESMLSLTEHDDKQVHQSARHFRDRWIPKFVRKANCLDRDDGGMEFHRGSSCGRVSVSHNNRRDDAVRSTKAIDCVMQSVPVTTLVDGTVQEGSSAPSAGGYKTNGAKTRKRKSRWDQPAEPKTNLGSSISPNIGRVDHLEEVSREDGSCLEYIHSLCQENETICATNGGINSPEDVPPGFSSPPNPTPVSSSTSITPRSVGCLSCPLEVVVGNLQGKFISRLPMSYGIPLPIVQQIGSPDNETRENWVIAPGMPFHPFPPLPPYPCDTKSTPHCTVKSMATNEHAQKLRKDSLDNTGCYPHESNHGTNFSHQSEANFQLANVQQTCKRARGSSYDLGKKYDGQKKWNKVPPWVRRSMDWGYVGNNL